MAERLVAALTLDPVPPDLAALFLTALPPPVGPLAGIVVSGGVGEYVAGRETRDFGDLGPALGHALRRAIDAGRLGAPLLAASACIRATALGASEYSVQLSGQTSTISAPGRLLPRRSLPVLRPDLDFRRRPDAETIARAIADRFAAFDLDPAADEAALAFSWGLPPDYANIRTLADGIVAGMAPRLATGAALFVMLDGDIAQTLGGVLREDLGLGNDLLILDGLSLADFDYIDLGKVRLPSFTVPVTVKSLLFRDDPRRAERVQFAGPSLVRHAAGAAPGAAGPQTHSHPHPHAAED
jgi:ethanolamine utilization protein EutA